MTSIDQGRAAIAILWDGYYATTYLGSVHQQVSDFAGDDTDTKRLVINATGWLLDRELVVLYSVDTRRPPGETQSYWTGSTAEQLARLDAVYDFDAPDWHDWWYSCWFENTEAGDALAEANPPEPWTDDDEESSSSR